jgi:hypothetical protein
VDGPIIIEPQPCGLDHASGVVPTRYGPVKIAWKVRDGRLQIDVDVPEGAPVDLREPPGFEGRAEHH